MIAKEMTKIYENFIRDNIKIHHSSQECKGRVEYPYLSDGYEFGNQATKYISALGKGNKRRFTLLLDDDIYDEVIAEASVKNMRRNTYLNTMIRDTIGSREASAV